MKACTDYFPKIYAVLYSFFIDWIIPPHWRRSALAAAQGMVLEIGAGSGANFPYYPETCASLLMTDRDPDMLQQAHIRHSRPGHSFPIRLEVADVQHLPYASASFDTIVSTFVFCTVTDPVRGLQECRRVLKPGGTLIALEHVSSRRPLPRLLLRALQPLSLWLLGDNLLRDTVANLKAAGFHITECRHLKSDFVLLITAK